MEKPKDLPLCIDLDGTLIRSDLLWESLLLLVKGQPWVLFILPFLLLKGKAGFKAWIAARVMPDVTLLPYHQPFLDYLKQQTRPLILATASHEKFANAIAKHLKIFSSVLSSSDRVNLSGTRKLQRIQEEVGESFGYAGNAAVDCKIWDHAAEVILVDAPVKFQKRYLSAKIFNESRNRLTAVVKAIRAHQWVKNSLIFIPAIMAQKILDVTVLGSAGIAFAAFSACASSVYIINDLMDLEADRFHSRKRKRSFASGDLPIPVGIFLVPILLATAGWLAMQLSEGFQVVLLSYFVVTTAYSFFLKSLAVIDIIVLAILYTLRIVAGGEATGIENSEWLLGFSFFLFLSLALVKRFSELKKLAPSAGAKAKGRGYFAEDIEQIATFGTTSGYVSVLVVALDLNSSHLKEFYSHPQFLWLLCPVLLYWVSRIWLLARRGEMHDDPVVFAIKDFPSYMTAAVVLFILLLAK